MTEQTVANTGTANVERATEFTTTCGTIIPRRACTQIVTTTENAISTQTR